MGLIRFKGSMMECYNSKGYSRAQEEAIKAVETDMLRNGWFNNFQDASKYALEKLNNKLMEKQEQ